MNSCFMSMCRAVSGIALLHSAHFPPLPKAPFGAQRMLFRNAAGNSNYCWETSYDVTTNG